ncbi:hypothetical protein Cpir12675_001543 [Ceratocystis pirilliformis]|uniref:aldehyde dehydrogenase (NAD(+)) n=1 Tax=Ceratocystis pirilliformis TaxID=259994 RepID=A0ABR3ZFW0_9PEZI
MSPETITTISPVTNQPIITRDGISEAKLESMSAVAAEAFKSWSKTTLQQRQAIIKNALHTLTAKRDELGAELTDQMGRPINYTPKEIDTAIMRSEYLLKVSDDVLKDTPGDAQDGFQRYIRKVPVGPVLIIFAWNVSTGTQKAPQVYKPPPPPLHAQWRYPYLILVNALVPALLAGNTVILKPSPQTPTVVEHVAAAFEQAGLPRGVLQYFHSGAPAVIETIVRNPKISLVCFTGSVAGGLAVQKAAAGRIVNVGLELGGKDAAYVRDDVDIAWAAEEIVDGAVFNSGQSCCSIERVYVAANVHDAFVAAVQKVLAGYILGDPTDKATHLGPVVSRRSKLAIEAHIKDALAKGAVDATPANTSFGNPPVAGNYVKPTLLTGVTHDMAVMTEETFGPVIPIMKVANDEEAVRLMNDSDFGLTASIWTADVSHGHKLADDIEAGTVFVNRCDYPSPDLAWTGWKNSGKGQTLSRFGFDQFVKLKSYHIKDYPK